jgi:hypothetical protein
MMRRTSLIVNIKSIPIIINRSIGTQIGNQIETQLGTQKRSIGTHLATYNHFINASKLKIIHSDTKKNKTPIEKLVKHFFIILYFCYYIFINCIINMYYIL